MNERTGMKKQGKGNGGAENREGMKTMLNERRRMGKNEKRKE